MELLLWAIVIALLAIDLDRHQSCHQLDQPQSRPSIKDEVRVAEQRIKRLSDETLLAMLDEVRRWEPGDAAGAPGPRADVRPAWGDFVDGLFGESPKDNGRGSRPPRAG